MYVRKNNVDQKEPVEGVEPSTIRLKVWRSTD